MGYCELWQLLNCGICQIAWVQSIYLKSCFLTERSKTTIEFNLWSFLLPHGQYESVNTDSLGILVP